MVRQRSQGGHRAVSRLEAPYLSLFGRKRPLLACLFLAAALSSATAESRLRGAESANEHAPGKDEDAVADVYPSEKQRRVGHRGLKNKKDKKAAPAPAPAPAEQTVAVASQQAKGQSQPSGIVSYSSNSNSGGGGKSLNLGKVTRTVKRCVMFDVKTKSSSAVWVTGFDFWTIDAAGSFGFQVYTKEGSYSGFEGDAAAWQPTGCGSVPGGNALKSTPSGSIKPVQVKGGGSTTAFFVCLDAGKLGLARGRLPNTEVAGNGQLAVIGGGKANSLGKWSANVNDWTRNVGLQGSLRYSAGPVPVANPPCLANFFVPAPAAPAAESCDIEAKITCAGPGGYDCKALSKDPVSKCKPSGIKLMYTGNDCWDNTNPAPGMEKMGIGGTGSSYCSYNDNVQLGHETAKITITDRFRGGNHLVWYQKTGQYRKNRGEFTVNVGDVFTVTAERAAPYNNILQGYIKIFAKKASGQNAGRPSQVVNISTDPAEGVLEIGHQMGAFELVGFESSCQGRVPIQRPSSVPLKYTCRVHNHGDRPVTLNSSGGVCSFSNVVLNNGKSTSTTVTKYVNANAANIVKSETMKVGAVAQNGGGTCRDVDTYSMNLTL